MKARITTYSLISFLIGLIIMGYELTVSRLIAPFYGNSVYTWGILLSVVMAALSLGYFLGGRLADKTKQPTTTLALTLFLSGFILFLSYFSSQYLLQQSLQFVAQSSSAWLYLLILTIAMLCSFAPAMTLLGMVSPILLKLSVKGLKSIGNTAGILSMVGSFGGITGSVMASFILIPTIGVLHSIQLFSILLSLSSLLVVFNRKTSQLVALLIIGIVLVDRIYQVFVIKVQADVVMESLYNHIKISDHNGRLYLSTGNARGVQTISIPESGIMNNYLDYLALAPSLLQKEKPHSVLLIGVAGGTVIKQLNQFFPDAVEIDAVEIDPTMIEVAKDYFALSDSEANIIIEEGRKYIATTQKKYDVVLIDAFSTDLYAPSHLMTQEFFAQIKTVLQPDGIMVFNAVSPQLAQDGPTLFQVIVNTVASIFPYTYHAPVRDNQFLISNNMIYASNSQIGDVENILDFTDPAVNEVATTIRERIHQVNIDDELPFLTDDKAPVELLYWKMLGK
ncbi:MAG TPA: fused MFS/spermidine synthase [Candidatus Woesebacteria bacterium]|jgi:spermidine synthase|nr:fused MFS/spermidine synthase [Candidatus Woesebacteria bacterium]HNS65302.1 fused MFS/spermidine synthase [Candidatus Woesebacteria bacterium]